MDKYTVTFRELEKGSYVSVNLYSHYTCITGKESGEGKTLFFSYIEDGINDSSIEVTVSGGLRFTLGTGATLDALLDVEVFPTYVGVIPVSSNMMAVEDGIPRVCGGDPT